MAYYNPYKIGQDDPQYTANNRGFEHCSRWPLASTNKGDPFFVNRLMNET